MTQKELSQILEKNPFVKPSELLYTYIKDEIVGMRILPGEKINMTKIAEEMNLSRTPVRSALEMLVQDGLVERVAVLYAKTGRRIRGRSGNGSHYKRGIGSAFALYSE